MFRIGEHNSRFKDFEEKKRRHEDLKERLSQISEVRSSAGETESEDEGNNSCNHSEEEAQPNDITGFNFQAGTATNEKLGNHKGHVKNAFEVQKE